jgi:hypothetical protein
MSIFLFLAVWWQIDYSRVWTHHVYHDKGLTVRSDSKKRIKRVPRNLRKGPHVFEKTMFFALLRMTIKVNEFVTHYMFEWFQMYLHSLESSLAARRIIGR